MKMGCLLGALALLASFAAGEPLTEAAVPSQAWEWLDFSGPETAVPYDEEFETELPAFPGVAFRWTAYAVTAVTGEGEQELLAGYPVESVYFCDLTGDGKPELCANVSFGFGWIDERILVYDYAGGAAYELENRGESDYRLVLEEGQLLAIQLKAPFGEEVARGQLVLDGGKLRIDAEK